MTYTTRDLTKDEGDALTKDLQAVLEKHQCEMGVVSSIKLLKRIEVNEEGIPTPYGDSDKPTEEIPETEA